MGQRFVEANLTTPLRGAGYIDQTSARTLVFAASRRHLPHIWSVQTNRSRCIDLLLIAARMTAVLAAAGAVDFGNAIKSTARKIDAHWILVGRSLRAATIRAATGFDQHRLSNVLRSLRASTFAHR